MSATATLNPETIDTLTNVAGAALKALPLLDVAGIAVFALSGALAAARAKQTLVTFAFFALMTGVGGGTIRDLLIVALVAALILLCAAIAKPYQATPLLLLAAAMGALNGVFERDGEVSVGLTYMTGTLVRLGQGLARWMMRDGDVDGWLRHAILWTSFLGGGLVGVGLYWRIALATLYVAGIAAAALALWLWWVERPRRIAAAPDADTTAPE